MKEIVRSVVSQRIEVSEVKFENGQINEVVLEPFVVNANSMTNEKALKLAKARFGKMKQLVIKNIVKETVKYACPVDVFMDNARVVEDEKGEEE